MDEQKSDAIDASRGEQVHFAQLTPNPLPKRYPIWNSGTTVHRQRDAIALMS
jgi:hypothetical protein